MRIDDTLRVSHKAISLHSNVILSIKNDYSHIHNVITKVCFKVTAMATKQFWNTIKAVYHDFIFLESF